MYTKSNINECEIISKQVLKQWTHLC